MTVTRLIGYLGTQPDIQAKLTAARDSLIEAAAQMKEINDIIIKKFKKAYHS